MQISAMDPVIENSFIIINPFYLEACFFSC